MIENRVLFSHYGRGQELCELLRKELNVPAGVKWFEVRFEADEAIVVQCEYLPQVHNLSA